MKKLFFLVSSMLFSQFLFANNFRVEIAVFDQSVGYSYFHNVENVKLLVDVNNLHRYYLGDFESLQEAERIKKELVAKGYKYAKVIDLKAKREACAAACQAPLYVQNIFFDFDRSTLRTKSKNDLDNLTFLMKDNPDYKVELDAHTDSKGSNDYNIALSQRRAEAAKAYLLSKGIASNRVKTSEFGETSPIAKNNLGGEDSPTGRQFNRRVVVTVIDGNGKIVPNIVRPIDVPTTLQAN